MVIRLKCPAFSCEPWRAPKKGRQIWPSLYPRPFGHTKVVQSALMQEVWDLQFKVFGYVIIYPFQIFMLQGHFKLHSAQFQYQAFFSAIFMGLIAHCHMIIVITIDFCYLVKNQNTNVQLLRPHCSLRTNNDSFSQRKNKRAQQQWGKSAWMYHSYLPIHLYQLTI